MTLSNGNAFAYQWDTGLKVVTTDPEGTVRRFANEHGSRSIPVEAVDESGTVYYHIPNILLTTGRGIVMYALGGNGDDNIYTNTEDFLPVYAAPKPDGYIFTDEEINLWKELCDRMDTAESNIATNATNIGLNTAAIAANTLAIGTNTGNITTLQGAMTAAQGDISAIKSSPHVHVFDTYESGDTWYSDESFDDLVAAFHRGDHIYCYGPFGLVMPMVWAEYTESPDEAYVVFGVPLQASANNEYGPSIGWLIAEYASNAWTITLEQDMIPQWLDSTGVTPGYVPTMTADGVEWQAPQGGGGSDSVYIITLDQYDTPTNTISEIEDAIDAGKLLVAVNTESNGYGYVVMYKGEYDATSLDLYASSVDPASGVSVTAWSKQYTYTYASQTWSITASNANQYTLPGGGTTGQALVKNSNSVGDTKWANIIPAPASPNDGDVITYDSNDGEWVAQAPSGGSTDIFVIQLDDNLLPLCTASDVIGAINGKKVIALSHEKYRASPLLDTSNNMVAHYAAYTASGVSVLALQPTGNTDADTFTAIEYHWAHDGNSWSVTSTAVTVESVPAGGTTGQVLAKASGTDYDASWTSLSASDVGAVALPSTPTAGDVITWSGSAWVAQALPVYDGS